MSSDAWPSPDSAPAPLPRIEDLPIADRGYDQEAVRIAFDSFYRHAAQLDASLRALEAVEVFRRDADALRNDLRALRSLGVDGGSDPTWLPADYGRPRPEVPGVVFRLAAEAALIVAVAVLAGVGNFRPVVIVALMAAAFAVVALAEWLASRARFVPPAVAFLPPLEPEAEPAPYVEAPYLDGHVPWGAPAALEAVEDTEADALTVVEAPVADKDADEVADDESDEDVDADEDDDEDEDDEDESDDDVVDLEDVDDEDAAALDPWEQGAPLVDDEPELSEPEPELVERGGIFRRRRR